MLNKKARRDGSSTTRHALDSRHSFLVRIWHEEGHSGWRGWVQHTRSGDAAFVHSLGELLAFLERRTGALKDQVQKKLK